MNPPPVKSTTSDAPPPGTASDARIDHLFRIARREGRIHPLQHLIQRYRQQGGGKEPQP